MNAERYALEAGLLADPDNLAAHAAYADWLIEHDDPRGEFLRLQLALEADDVGKVVRRRPWNDDPRLRQAVKRLLPQVLGRLLMHTELAAGRKPGSGTVAVRFHRGWIDELKIEKATPRILAAVATVPTLLLRSLRITEPCDRSITAALGRLPLPGLRSLVIDDHQFTDDDLAVIVSAPYFAVLEEFVMYRGGTITDSGAVLLAEALSKRPRMRLTISGNYISPIGRAALADVGYGSGIQRFDQPFESPVPDPTVWI